MAQVKLILQEEVQNLGHAGDLVSVKPGYARNFLVPQGKAIPATEARVKELEHIKRVVEEKVAKELKDLQVVKRALEKLRLSVGARAGEGGKLFGSVTSAQIHEQLVEKGYDQLERRKIVLDDPIKEVGDHVVHVRLHRDMIADVKVEVVAEGAPEPEPAAVEEEPDEDDRRRFDDGNDDDDDE